MSKKIYDLFDRQLSLKLGHVFKRVSIPGSNKAYWMYEFRRDDGLLAHLWFIVQSNYGTKTIRLFGSWTTTGIVPIGGLPGYYPIDIPEKKIIRDRPKNGQMVFWLSYLWKEHSPIGWDITGKSDSEIASLINDVIDKITLFAVPYFLMQAGKD